MSQETTWTDPSNRIQLVGSMNRFAFRLFEQVCRGRTDNLFLSPSSISTTLAMTLAGSGGETQDELMASLGFPFSDAKLYEAFRELSECTRTGGVEFRSVNRIWGQSSYSFLADFFRVTREYFGAELSEVDFKNDVESARLQINSWVAEQTANRITDLIPPGCLDHMARLVLTNAVYFLGSWDEAFDKDRTHEADFFMSPGNAAKVPMMHQAESFQYGKCESFQVLEMPYKSYGIVTETVEVQGEECEQPCRVDEEGSDFSLVVLLPRPEVDLETVAQQLAAESIQGVPRLGHREVRVYLPRFRVDSEFFLGDTLQQLGMHKSFSLNDADFSRMSNDPEGLFISEVLHKAFVEVNEEGTEAAAATGVFMVAGCAGATPPPVDFRADRPFIFLIRDTATGLVHFVGRYMGPQ